MSARSIPAFGWNAACVCVPSPLVTPAGDVDGPRPRPRAPGTLPLGTARPGPSSLPRARPEAGSGRGWPEAWRPVGPWLWALISLRESLLPAKEEPGLPVGSRPNLLFVRRGKPLELQSNRTFRAHTFPLTPKRSHRDLLATSPATLWNEPGEEGANFGASRTGERDGDFRCPCPHSPLLPAPGFRALQKRGLGKDLGFRAAPRASSLISRGVCAAAGGSCPP